MAGKKVKQAAQGKEKEWQVEWLEINSLNPYENNARKEDIAAHEALPEK